MSRFGFVGPSYTARSTAVADEECINFFLESIGSQGAIVAKKAYGGSGAQGLMSLYGTPGLTLFTTLPTGPVRGSCWTGSRAFFVGGGQLIEVASDGTQTVRGMVANDGKPVSMCFSNIQVLIVSAAYAYCFTLASNALLDVTPQMLGTPVKVDYSDTYFVVQLAGNKYQWSNPLDGTTWNGLYVNEVSVFPENIVSVICNHRELWVFGSLHFQPYQDTGSNEVFDVIPGAMMETGCVGTFSPCRADNSIFWVSQDERGACIAWRSQGYTPVRISTYAVETYLAAQAQVASMVTYAYQDSGHLFWVIYVPGADCSWVYDVAEGLWHKRANWNGLVWGPHWSWNHIYAFGKHLVGDWNTGNVYAMSMSAYTDNGTTIRRLRRSPTVSQEMEWIPIGKLTVDFETGDGPQPPLTDGSGNPRPPQAMLRWSDDRGRNWSNEHIRGCGFAGQFTTRSIWRRLGRTRYRVFELSVSDPVPWTIVDAYIDEVEGP